MPSFLAGLVLLFLLLAALRQFSRVSPAAAARVVRYAGGAASAFGALLLLLRGRIGLAAMLAGLAAAMFGRPGFSRMFGSGGFTGASGAGRWSEARTTTLAMRLDHDTGAIEGAVVGGPYAGAPLASLTLSQCLEVLANCRRDDPDGARLLETYLDRRFARWREAEQSEFDGRGRKASAGAMTREEAYETLGLPDGASAEEIIRAHRALMQKLHPDHGGSTALAARVNQAKDTLLARHGTP